MKSDKRFLTLLLTITTICLFKGCTKEFPLLSYFQEVSFEEFIHNNAPRPLEKDLLALPDNVVVNQLLFVKNDNLFNRYNGQPIKYFPLFKVKGIGYWLIAYYSSDCSEQKTVFSIFSEKEKRITKELLVKDVIQGTSLVSYIIEAQNSKSLNDVYIVVDDRRTPGNVEPLVSYHTDKYKLDNNLTYTNTFVFIGDHTETDYYDNYSYNAYEDENSESDLFDYFVTRASIPSFEEALKCSKTIPNRHLFHLFSHNPMRDHPYNILGAIKTKVNDGWLLYIIQSNGIEADAFLCKYSEGGGPYSFLHIFIGSDVDLIPFDINYKVNGNNLTISNYIKENDKNKPDVIIQRYSLY